MVPFETATFRAVAEDMGDPGCALNFLGNHLRMLSHRMARIISHLGDQNSKATMDAVLSLRVSSATTGVQEAGTRCRDIEALLRHNQLEAAGVAARSLNRLLDGLIADSQDVLGEARNQLRLNCQNSRDPAVGPKLSGGIDIVTTTDSVIRPGPIAARSKAVG